MKSYRVKGIVKIEVVTIAHGETEEEAIKSCSERETSICIHGSELEDEGYVTSMEFVPVDAVPEGFPENLYIESEIDPNSDDETSEN